MKYILYPRALGKSILDDVARIEVDTPESEVPQPPDLVMVSIDELTERPPRQYIIDRGL